MLEPPKITIYSRILSNIDGSQVEGFTDVTKYSKMNFGSINRFSGGESQYILELDIWNNEPAIYSGYLPLQVKDAINCRFSAWENSTCTAWQAITHNNQSFVLASNKDSSQKENFIRIAGNNSLDSQKITSQSDSTKKGIILGKPGGDHAIIQVKISSPEGISFGQKDFYLSFQYDFI